jgi:hypothetical protein
MGNKSSKQNTCFMLGAIIMFCLQQTAFAGIAYDLVFDSKKIAGTREIDGKSEKLNFNATEEDGIVFIDPRQIAKQLGDSKRAERHPFSFAEPEETRIRVKIPENYFVFSSFPSAGGIYLPRSASQWVIGIAHKSLWNKSSFVFKGTQFELVSPKSKPSISERHWEESVKSIWTAFTKRFGNPSDHVVFVDLNGPISGGPLGENVLGIFASEKIDPKIQEDIQANLGWSPQPSTRAYVEANYPSNKNKWEEYLFGTFAHELGHFYFGFGLTRQDVTRTEDLWCSLGLGMLYDMEVTAELLGREPQLEVDIIKSWQDRYANLQDIDQRLINPDTSGDKKYPFDRKKVFAHGKATYYLRKVRGKIGAATFDQAVKQYLKCSDCRKGYESFKTFLGTSSGMLAELEATHRVR